MSVLESVFFNATYILAIALQLAAAILLIGNTDTRREKIVLSYCDRHTALAFNEDGTMLDRTVLEEIVKNTWTNNIAFKYLFVGYLISIFGKCSIDKTLALLLISFLTLTLYVVPFSLAKRKAKHFASICKDEIPMRDGVMVVEI